MKKILSIFLLLTICGALTACNTSELSNTEEKNFSELKFVNVHADYIHLSKSFDDIEESSDFVVVGEFIDDASVCYERYVYEDYFKKDVLRGIISSCPMKITKVLSDNSGNAKVGDVVNVLQWEGIWEDRFITTSALTPMLKGDEWVFCLSYTKTENYEGYVCEGGCAGRYPTSNVSSNNKMCFSDYPELGVYNKDDFREDYYNQLLEKYDV